jgi:GH24 family phage-related lysozyme (muramidase)
MPLDNKISNIIGTKLPQWVLNQLETRSNKNTQDSRDNDNILYLANKSAWVRLVSSINIGSEDLEYFKRLVGYETIEDQTSLAKQYVLFGGTSKYLNKNSYQLRSGLGKDGAYGILGENEIQQFGYKPMPGITSVTIETQGKLGSIRGAIINFKCWDKNQLDIIDALYFKLGFTMFLEWGHTFFYPSPQNTYQRDPNKIISTELYSIDPFEEGLNKEDIQIRIAKNSRETEGNYDAMLGICTNFNFTYTQDGGYDCTLRLMGLGVLGDSIKINNAGTLPNLLEEEIKQLNSTLIEIAKANNQANGTASGANQNGDPQNIKSYASCIQNLPGVKIADVSKSPSPNKDRRLSTFAANATINGEDLYLYLDGQYQTTGFSKSGRWECIDGQVVLDGIRSILSFLNQKINNKQGEPDINQLQNIASKYGYPGSKVATVYDYDYLYEIENRGSTLLFPRFGAILPTDKTNEVVSSITIDNNYLFEKISNFLQFKEPIQTAPVTPASLPQTIPGTPIPAAQPIIQSAQLAANTLEFSMFNNRNITNDQELIRLDIDYLGASPIVDISKSTQRKKYYASLRVEFSRSNPNFKKEILNRQAVYEAAISKFRSSNNIEFTTISFESRPLVENFGTTPKPFGTVTQNDTNSTSGRYPVIKLSTTINVPVNGTVLRKVAQTEGTIVTPTQGTVEIPVSIDLYITDTSLISNIKKGSDSPNYLKTQQDLSNQNQQQTTAEEDTKEDLEAISTQIKQALNYQSTLEIMLRTIQLHALNKAINKTGTPDLEIGRTTYVLNISDKNDKIGDKTFLNQIFSTGIFSSFIQKLVNEEIKDDAYTTDKKMNPIERFQIHSKYGFATSLLGNKENILLLQPVDFKELLKAYVIPYQIDQEIIKGTSTNHPVYIPLGLVLMILNHACTIYDSKELGKFQTPLVYIDFNPELNFCLTNTKQLSTDPWTCLIPFEGSFEDYKQLFDKNILTSGSSAIDHTSGSTEIIPLFNPDTQDYLSKTLPKIKFDEKTNSDFVTKINSFLSPSETQKESGNVYRGKMMNILVNIDYLVQLAQQYSYKDGTNSVYLKTFIEQMLSDINKSLGNFNAFRLSYNDSANTFQIIDDQFVPSLSSEEQVTPKSNRTELPLSGKFSIAKALEIKSEISSRLSNMLAISANSNYQNKASLSTNGDSFGFINTAYTDRYVTIRGEITGSTEPQKDKNDSLKISAAQFNSTISDFYSKINPSQTNVAHATNYYIEKMSIVKNDDYATRASSMIPVSVNFSTDGISGLGMGQAFTVSDQLLPYTYTTRKIPGAPQDHVNNVGFIMVGLTHTIESNQWNTAVRANMIYLKDKTEFTGSVVKTNFATGVLGINESNDISIAIGSVSISDLNTNQEWQNISFDYISSKEGFLASPKNDEGTLRAGYGTSIIVDETGKIKTVGIDTVFTKESAKRTLIYQIKNQFSKKVINQIGQLNWNNLNDRQKASLVSYVYNVGSLNSRIVLAIKSNTGAQTVANIIASGPYSGKVSGYLPTLEKRRKEEAALYLS